MLKILKLILKNRLYNESEHFSGRIGALMWSILVGGPDWLMNGTSGYE